MTEVHTESVLCCNLRSQVAVICPQVSKKDMDLHQCFDNRRKSFPFVEENGYSASFDSGANNWLAFWLYLVASSYFLLSKQVNFFSGGRVKSEEDVSLSNRSIPNERKKNDATVVEDAVSFTESLGSPHSTCSPTYFDAYSEISDFDDRTSYWHSLLSLEEEDTDWLSDSMISENPSSPLSYSGDSFTEFSDADTPSYWDSLLKLEEEDREWYMDKASYQHSLLSLEEEDSEWLSDSMISENPSSPLSYSGDSFTEFSDVGTPSYWDSLLKLEEEDREWYMDKASYWHSLLSLEDEDSEWLSDSMTSENPSSPLSFSGDSFFDTSDIGTPSYWDSLLRLDEEDNNEWISDSKQGLECIQDGSPVTTYKINWGTVVLPPISTISSFNGDEPLFWPFDEEFDWNSDESSFCNSPRKKLVFDSNRNIPLDYFSLDQEFTIETLVGLKEFDGHEGLDYEFIGDGFMLEESLQ